MFTLLLAMMCVAGFGQTLPEEYRGTWTGKISVGGSELELVFHLGDECTLDVPGQGAKGIKASYSLPAEGALKIDIAMLRAFYEGKFADGKFTGTFHQHGLALPLSLAKGEAAKVNRPQTPVAPFPYKMEEVRFANGDAVLSGTLTTPETFTTNTPVVLMITGSGQQNRDEEVFEHKPFAVIADAFARNGIATLRYDDRGFAKSTGNAANATTDTLAADAAAGIRFLRDKGFTRVGALGHSEGGTIAFLLAAEGLTDFIVSMAGGIAKGEDILRSQLEAQLTAKGATSEQAQQYALQAVAQSRAGGNPWMKRFLDFDPAESIKRTACPVLALNGALDIQVLSERNIPLLQTLLPTAETKIYPRLNHLFQTTPSSMTSYYDIEETISPEVLQDMVAWIKGSEYYDWEFMDAR